MSIFEWHENKNVLNVEKHGISFSVAVKVFESECLTYKSSHSTETRYVAVGEVNGKAIAVVYTVRHEKIRIISARRARKKEERAYRQIRAQQSSRTH